MPHPNNFISNSDYASTPAPLSGGKIIDLTTPANIQVYEYQTKVFSSTIYFDEPFDSVQYIITCDEFPNVSCINNGFTEFGLADMMVSLDISDNNSATLYATFTQFWDATFADVRHLHAYVVPIKSPFNQA